MPRWPKRLNRTVIATTLLRVDADYLRSRMSLNHAVMSSNPARHLDQYRADWKRNAEFQDGYHSGGDLTRELRHAAWDEFQRLGFPIHRRGNEIWKYTDLRPIDRIGFRLSAEEHPVEFEELAKRLPVREDSNCAVFVNGFLQEDSRRRSYNPDSSM